MRLRISSQPGPRRRLMALAAASLVAFATGVEIGARSGGEPAEEPVAASGASEPDPLAGMSLRQRVGQLVMLRFDGTELPSYVARAMRAAEATGAILFADNVASEDQLRSLTRSLQRSSRRSALVAVDQEGGTTRAVPFAAPEPAAGAVSRPTVAERLSRQAGRDLAELGVNVNLAPVADVASVPESVMAGRAYPGGPASVARLARAAIRGQEAAGIASTAKHFPGLGAATANTDDAPVTIANRSLRELRSVDLEPFRAAVEADVPLVMASHALYPALDRRRIASQSPVALEGLLRRELGYDGVIVTDSMEAEAVLSRSTTPAAAVASVEAGADVVLTTLSASYAPVLERLLAAARRSERFRARVDEAAARVLELKERLGLTAPRTG